MASGVVACHILECGAYASGGNFTVWQNVPSFLSMGYPTEDFSQDNSFQVSKYEHSGGLVNQETVTSQLVYEMGDPQNSLTPDVIADFSSIHLKEEGKNNVKVSAVRGRGAPHTNQLKVSISDHSSCKTHRMMIVRRPEAAAKCRTMAACSGTSWIRILSKPPLNWRVIVPDTSTWHPRSIRRKCCFAWVSEI